MKLRLQLLCLAAVLATASVHAQLKPSPAIRGAASSAPQPAVVPAKPMAPEGVKVDETKEGEGKLAATGWLTLLDRRDWGTAWERSGMLFRKTVPLGTWMDNIPKVREPLGTLVDRQVVGVIYRTALAGYPNGDYVTVSFLTKFDKKADVKEQVTTVKEADGRWRVTGYIAQ